MSEWVYKATTTKANYDDTHDLAILDRFLCRSAYEAGSDDDGLRLVGKAVQVALGDLLHYYYRKDSGAVGSFGTFRIVDGATMSSMFEACSDHGALYRVNEALAKPKMLDRLRRGYRHDPKLGAFTGWVLERLPKSHPTPKFNQAGMFPFSQINLWQYPDPTLPRTKQTKKGA